MNQLSDSERARASKSYSRILQAFEKTGQNNIAVAMGCDASKISRLKAGELEQFCQVLAVCGLKIVPTEYKALDRDFVEAMLVMNKKLINRVHTVDDLAHSEISTRDDLDY